MTASIFSSKSRKKLAAITLLYSASHAHIAIAQNNEPEGTIEAQASTQKDTVQPSDVIGFSAERVSYDSGADIVTASGNVILNREGYELKADTVVWNRKSGEVTAQGNIRSIGPNGDTAYGDSITLTDTLKDGAVENLLLVMADGGRLAAQKGSRTDGALDLEYAAYSPCAVERPNGCPKRPSWQVKAVKVHYDPVKKRVTYEGARIELFGLPLIPLPFLSHPAETRAASGFLVPNLKYSRNNGAEIELPYYFRIAPNRDVVASATLFSKVAPLVQAKLRSFEKNGAFELSGYATYSSKISTSSAGVTNARRAIRGYLDGVGKFQLDPNWSLSGSIRFASDRTFLRRYDISDDDRLRSTIKLERVDTNSYFSLSGWAVQTLRLGDKQGLTPIALPEVDYRLRLAEPVLGGTIQLQANSLVISRTAGQDTQRAFASAKWDLRTITGLGQDISFTVFGRGDVYHSDENESTITAIYRGRSGWQSRGIFAAAADIRWPFVGQIFGGTQILTPRVQFVAAPTISNLRIPNEDSRAVDLEDSNLFSLNRFPGYDRFEDNYRVTVGVDWAFRGKNIAIDTNIGQSLRLSNRDTIFPDGTGLSEKLSDIVGRTEVRFRDIIKVNHRFRLDKDDLAIRRNEIDATIGTSGTYAQIGYLKLNRNIGPTIEDLSDREEIRVGGRAKIARYWSIFGSAIVDLTDRSEDLLSNSDGFAPVRHRLGISYDDDCLTVGFTWRRSYQAIGDARRGNSFLFRLAFRNLGV
jgi:LPS-assembly protein